MGEGEPVVIVQTALSVDELRPLAQLLSTRGRFRWSTTTAAATLERIGNGSGVGGRRGSRLPGPHDRARHRAGSRRRREFQRRDRADPGRVSTRDRADPDRGRTATRRRAELFTVSRREHPLLQTYETNGPLVALDEFMTMLSGPDWRAETERDVPGSLATMQRDAATFFESDVPKLLSWRFGADDAAGIGCPVLCVSGSDSGPWFARARGGGSSVASARREHGGAGRRPFDRHHPHPRRGNDPGRLPAPKPTGLTPASSQPEMRTRSVRPTALLEVTMTPPAGCSG